VVVRLILLLPVITLPVVARHLLSVHMERRKRWVAGWLAHGSGHAVPSLGEAAQPPPQLIVLIIPRIVWCTSVVQTATTVSCTTTDARESTNAVSPSRVVQGGDDLSGLAVSG
jgi:hypothetical protein